MVPLRQSLRAFVFIETVGKCTQFSLKKEKSYPSSGDHEPSQEVLILTILSDVGSIPRI
jgi:hypothetical protein